MTSSKVDQIWEDIYVCPFWRDLQNRKATEKKKERKKRFRFKYKVDQQVKISFLRKLFDREYHQKWTSEVYTIRNRVNESGVPVYYLNDLSGEPVDGSFYEAELQPVTLDPNSTFKN